MDMFIIFIVIDDSFIGQTCQIANFNYMYFILCLLF